MLNIGLRDKASIQKEIARLSSCCESRRRQENWLSLPIEGARFESCFIEHSGKRGNMIMLVEGFPPLHMEISHHVRFGSLDGIQQRLLALDDVNVGLLLFPHEGCAVRLIDAKVDYWIKDENAGEELRAPAEGDWELRAAFDLKLAFVRESLEEPMCRAGEQEHPAP